MKDVFRAHSRRPLSLDLAQQFIERARLVMTDEQLRCLLDDISRELGFDHFALIHHVDLRQSSPSVIHIQNYPSVWAERFIHDRLFLDDPILQATLRTNVGFAWDEVSSLITMTNRQRNILDRARAEGLGGGFTVPANVPGEAHGSCSFATSVARSLPRHNLLTAQLIGIFVFQAARRLSLAQSPQPTEPVKLTPRQCECLIFVARGKTDWEIGQILGLQEDSVTKIVNAARERYDVANRTELVTAALFDGQISFTEIRY